MWLPLALVILGGSLLACEALAPSTGDCDAIILGWTPEDLRVQGVGQRHSAGGERFGTVVTRQGVAGRELSVLSGVAFGDFAGSETGEVVVIGDQDVPIFSTGDTYFVRWQEARPEEPCNAYAVIGVKVTADEFNRIASSIEIRGVGP